MPERKNEINKCLRPDGFCPAHFDITIITKADLLRKAINRSYPASLNPLRAKQIEALHDVATQHENSIRKLREDGQLCNNCNPDAQIK